MVIDGVKVTAESFRSSFKVDSDVIRAKAQNVQVKINEIKNAFDEMEQSVNRTNQYWIGEAGDAHREYFKSRKDDIQTLFRRWNEEVSDMYQMASVYSQTEAEVEALAEDLPFDVIV
jgi:uncharacterized protein YukE